MNKEEPLDQFLKTLRLSLNYISLYSRSHRAFLSSVGVLKEKLGALLEVADPLEIGVTPDSLIINGQTYAATALHRELARLFHGRKIKSMRFCGGITERELEAGLAAAALPVKELLARGGLKALIAQAGISHFMVEELDYSRLLKHDGQESGDVWGFLLNDALSENDSRKIDEFLATFESMIPRIRPQNLLDDPALRHNVFRLLGYLKGKDPETYARCGAALLATVLRDKVTAVDVRASELKELFADLDAEQLARVLWEEISLDDDFDSRSLELFTQIAGRDKHEKIADLMVKRANREKGKGADPARIKRFKSLFSLSGGGSYIPESYRKAIAAISEQQYFSRGFAFDRNSLQANYDRILLGLLTLENDPKQRELIFAMLARSWDKLAGRVDVPYFLALKDVLASAPATGAAAALSSRFHRFIEQGSWSPQFPGELRELCLAREESALDGETYLQRIFGQEAPNPAVLELYFKFFPQGREDFLERLAGRFGDFEFISSMIRCLTAVPGGGEILQKMYFLANDLVKVEIARTLLEKGDNREFFVTVIPKESFFLKKEILSFLLKEPEPLSRALRALLDMPNPWGRNNDLLLENLMAIDELNCRAAAAQVRALAGKNFIFGAAVVSAAKRILRKWDA